MITRCSKCNKFRMEDELYKPYWISLTKWESVCVSCLEVLGDHFIELIEWESTKLTRLPYITETQEEKYESLEDEYYEHFPIIIGRVPVEKRVSNWVSLLEELLNNRKRERRKGENVPICKSIGE